MTSFNTRVRLVNLANLRLSKHDEMQRGLPCGNHLSRDHQNISAVVLCVLQNLCQVCLSLCSRMISMACKGYHRHIQRKTTSAHLSLLQRASAPLCPQGWQMPPVSVPGLHCLP